MDILKLSREVVERYRRYLLTTFAFRDPALRASFEEALSREALSRGPYIEATPPFRRGKTPRELFRQLLNRLPDEGFLKALFGDRQLYRHQEEAIRRVAVGQNVVVATGTGSGKTEAFLYPILLHLYQEHLRGELGPGVRALVLYPMNALAYDQRERLGELRRRLEEFGSPFRFTFGQYVGETPEDEEDARRQAQDHLERRLPGELVLRREMRKDPPHILLTNYSMLEYLLVRPDDSPLFDDGRARWWTFLVLDEAHQYRGTRGTEMALLLRRLKRRLREGGCKGSFRCIATSATLLGGGEERGSVARFAEELFGEPFSEDGIVLGELESPDSLPREEDRRALQLYRELAEGPQEAMALADRLFPDLPEMERGRALGELLRELMQTQDAEAPRLSVRYHLFLRSLEGAFVRYWPEPEVLLERKNSESEEETAIFELALCRECGQHYLVGQVEGNRFGEAVRDPSREDFGAQYLRPLEDRELLEDEEGGDLKGEVRLLCVRCGFLGTEAPCPGCGHSDLLKVVLEPSPDDDLRADQLKRCSSCGYVGSGDPVTEVIYGGEGPHVVVATALHQHLPSDRRRVLAFADGRQNAAFFAWYLERSYRDVFSRRLLLEAASRLTSEVGEVGLSLRDLAWELRSLLREYDVLSEAATDLELKREAWRLLYRELLTDEERISLAGVGLIRWELAFPSWIEVPEFLRRSPWDLSQEGAQGLLLYLLDTLRRERAIELKTEPGIRLEWGDLGLRASPLRVRLGPPRGSSGVRDWAGVRGRRVGFLSRLLLERGVPEERAISLAERALRAIWEAIKRGDERAPQSERLLLPIKDGRRLNPIWWRLILLSPEETIYRCETCGRLHPYRHPIEGLCTQFRCRGRLEPLSVRDLPDNHYRLLYQEELPGPLRVEEHTAQLSYEKARQYQREFKEGRIHVLSSSTTFELGVDLGDLDVVFLRNIPPEPFNYAQRVGRAGRREEPGFALTYCRRSPHDLYHFANPERMLRGWIRPPTLTLRNEKLLLRHMMAWALSSFFRSRPERFRSVGDFVGSWESPSIVPALREFLKSHRQGLRNALVEILPSEVYSTLGLEDDSWIDKLLDAEGRLQLAVDEVVSDYQVAKNLERKAASRGDYRTASWARDRAKTIASEDVLSFLSRKVVIPKYGFPVDVVELDTHPSFSQEQAEVALQRDLRIAISEFAPSAEVIANKKLWRSYGLKRVLERTWEIYDYKLCQRHNTFVRWSRGSKEEELPCGCPATPRSYVKPQFGFVTKREKPREPQGRPRRLFSTRPYFAGSVGPPPANCPLPRSLKEDPLLSLTPASPGRMIVLCEGRRGGGFYICRECGAGDRDLAQLKAHVTPYGQSCSGQLENFSLAHDFETDVLRLDLLFSSSDPHVGSPLSLAYSLAYAVVEAAAELLEVPSTDLNTVVIYDEDCYLPPILLYDDVPGGGGLVSRLEDEALLRECFELAAERVSGACGCGELASCYGCLRSYRNQFLHELLHRGPARRYLEELLSRWRRPRTWL